MTVAATSSDREVIFRIRAVSHEDNEAAMRRLGDRAIAEEQRLSKSVEAEVAKRVKTRLNEEERAAREAARIAKQQQREQETASKAAAKEAEKIAKQQQREQEAAQKAATRAAAKEASEAAKIAKQQQREQEVANREAAREADRQHQRHRERQRSIAAENRRLRQTEQAEQQRAAANMEANARAARSAIVSSNEAMIESFVGVTEGVAKVGRGFVALRLVGEKDSQAIIDGLLKIQGTFDLVTGSVQTVVRLQKGIRLMSAALAAADTVQKSSAITASLSSRASDSSAAALRREAAAANLSAAAHGRLAASRGASTVAGRGAAAAGSIGGRGAGAAVGGIGAAAGGGGAAAGGGAGAAGMIASIGPWVAAAVGVAAAAISGTSSFRAARKHGIGGGADVGSVTDKIATMEVSVASRIQRLTQKIGVDFDVLGGPVVMLGSRLLGITGAVKQLVKSSEDLERVEKSRVAITERMARVQEQVTAISRADIALRSARVNQASERREVRDMMAAAAPTGDRRGEIERRQAEVVEAIRESSAAQARAIEQGKAGLRESAEIEKRIQDLNRESFRLAQAKFESEIEAIGSQKDARRRSLDEESRMLAREIAAAERNRDKASQWSETQSEYEAQIAELSQRAAEVTRQKLQLELDSVGRAREIRKQEADELRRNHEQAIQGIREQINLRRQQAEAESDRLKSARERFGAMDPAEQRRLMMLQQRAQATGGRGLNQEQLDLLSGVGTRATEELVSRERQRRAEAAGFSRFFGQEERQNIAAARSEELKLNLQLQDQRSLKVEVSTTEADEELIRRLLNELRAENDRRQRAIESQINNQRTRDLEQANTRQYSTAAQDQ